MTLGRVVIFAFLLLILGVPFALRPAASDSGRSEGPTLVVVTPHVPQIQSEFSAAFDRWHRRVYGEGVRIDWRMPGGTSDILKQLEAQFQASAKAGAFDFTDPANPVAAPGTCPYDLMLGGGSFDHGRVKTGIKVRLASPTGEVERAIPMSAPAGFDRAELDAWFGANEVGAQLLYDPQQYWIGTALSGFGIVYNRDVLRGLGLPEPRGFEDLSDPRLAGWVSLSDPRQSGSVTTTLDSILSNFGWEKGWRTIRELCANTRYYTNSSTKPPIDVSHGEAAAGLAIDFYGRTQSQSVAAPGQDPSTSRVGYVDPKGAAYIDADPVSILRGGPNPVLAKRFVEFCLTEEAQALWQFPSEASGRGGDNPLGPDGRRMGPAQYELRRMPVRRVMYEKHFDHLMDRVDPFALASPTKTAGWRPAIGIMMGAFGIDNAHQQREAWAALNAARGAGASTETLAEMERLFYAFPPTVMPDGSVLAFGPDAIKPLAAAWKDPAFKARCEIEYTRFFRDNYRRVAALGGKH